MSGKQRLPIAFGICGALGLESLRSGPAVCGKGQC